MKKLSNAKIPKKPLLSIKSILYFNFFNKKNAFLRCSLTSYVIINPSLFSDFSLQAIKKPDFLAKKLSFFNNFKNPKNAPTTSFPAVIYFDISLSFSSLRTFFNFLLRFNFAHLLLYFYKIFRSPAVLSKHALSPLFHHLPQYSTISTLSLPLLSPDLIIFSTTQTCTDNPFSHQFSSSSSCNSPYIIDSSSSNFPSACTFSFLQSSS